MGNCDTGKRHHSNTTPPACAMGMEAWLDGWDGLDRMNSTGESNRQVSTRYGVQKRQQSGPGLSRGEGRGGREGGRKEGRIEGKVM